MAVLSTNKSAEQVTKRNSSTVNTQSATLANTSTAQAYKIAAIGGGAGKHPSSSHNATNKHRNKSKKV